MDMDIFNKIIIQCSISTNIIQCSIQRMAIQVGVGQSSIEMKPGGMREYGCESGCVCVCVDECSQVSVMRPTVTVQVVWELVSD